MKKYMFFILLVGFSLFISGCKDKYNTKREFRGVWLSRFDFTRGDTNLEIMKNRISNAMKNIRASKMNVVIFQVRGNADAFYKSDYEPWSKMLTGNLGQDPGWDPLQYAIETAHSLGLEIHAWINTFPIWRANDSLPTESVPRHVLLEHPEWVVCDRNGNPMQPTEGYISASPGNPEVTQHVKNVVMDIVKKYDIDGIHFDYIRYPEESAEKGYSGDAISMDRFRSKDGNPKNLKFEDWQRAQIDNFVSQVFDAVKNEKPYVKVSASVIGSYSTSNSKWNAFNSVYQNPKAWLENEKIDFIFPMTYMKMELFSKSMEEWATVTSKDLIYPGLAAYKAREWGWEEIINEIKYVRENGFSGFVFFAVSSLNDVWNELKSDYVSNWANIPEDKNKYYAKPRQVQNVVVERIDANRVKISWSLDNYGKDTYYNVYCNSTNSTDFDANNLIYITPRSINSCIHNTTKDFYYSVSALNRNNTEGDVSKPIKVGRSISGLKK